MTKSVTLGLASIVLIGLTFVPWYSARAGAVDIVLIVIVMAFGLNFYAAKLGTKWWLVVPAFFVCCFIFILIMTRHMD
jgi:hypothetical protein